MYRSENPDNGTTGSAVDELLQVTRELKENLGRLLGASRHVAGEQVQRFRSGATNFVQRGKDRAENIADSATGYVKEEPVKSLLIAAAAGCLIGYILKRSR